MLRGLKGRGFQPRRQASNRRPDEAGSRRVHSGGLAYRRRESNACLTTSITCSRVNSSDLRSARGMSQLAVIVGVGMSGYRYLI